MAKTYRTYLHNALYILLVSHTMCARSPHRPKEKDLPTLVAYQPGFPEQQGTLTSSHLELYPWFSQAVFDESYFFKHQLPGGPIPYRNNPNVMVQGSRLNELIQAVMLEIEQRKKTFKHFVVLRRINFNSRKKCGLIILKCKEYPFVLKLFIETPQTLLNPYCKGAYNTFFFYMAGGTNRHINGFTRIKNIELIKQRIANDPKWADKVDFPRKWFWIPQNPGWIYLNGTNIGGQKQVHTRIPNIYGIIADAIEEDGATRVDPHMAMQLCNDIDLCIDPHFDNFMIEKKTKKLVIVDTEHFPTVVGFKEKRQFKDHTQWYFSLAGKCTKDIYLRTKRERKLAQTAPNLLALR